MKALVFDDKPTKFPTVRVKGGALKPLTQVLLDRRATQHFEPDAVPEEHLQAILRFAAQAPSGYNLQPWRFVVVRDAENRKRLQKAAFDQPKVGEAPVVVVTFAIKDQWREVMDPLFEESVRRGVVSKEMVKKTRENAAKFMEKMPQNIWVNRHSMIAVTTLMLIAEAYGLDTAPMEGFDPEAVKKELGLPANSEVVAFMAIGFGREPDKAYGGRLSLDELVYNERYEESGSEKNESGDDDMKKSQHEKKEREPAYARQAHQPKTQGKESVALVCPGCEMQKDEWPGEGYTHDGETYCCQGCAEGTGCTCKKVSQPGFSREGQKATKAKPRKGEQHAGALEPKGELSGERDALGTEEAIDQEGYSSTFNK